MIDGLPTLSAGSHKKGDAAACVRRVRDEARVKFLSELIDEYDRLTGRNESREVTTGELCSLKEQVSA